MLSTGSVTLTFPQGFGTSTSWNGTLTGNSLILSYSASDGSLSTLTFHPGTVADYNAAVADAQAAAAAAGAEQDAAASAAAVQQAEEAQQAAAQQRLDDAVRSASNALDTALGQLTSDVDSVESSVGDMTGDAASANGALADVRGALTKVESEAAVTPMDDYQQSSVCYEVSRRRLRGQWRHLLHRPGPDQRRPRDTGGRRGPHRRQRRNGSHRRT